MVLYYLKVRERSLRREKGRRETPPLPPSLYVERPWEERASRGGKKSIERPGGVAVHWASGGGGSFHLPKSHFSVFGDRRFLLHVKCFLAYYEGPEKVGAEMAKFR